MTREIFVFVSFVEDLEDFKDSRLFGARLFGADSSGRFFVVPASAGPLWRKIILSVNSGALARGGAGERHFEEV